MFTRPDGKTDEEPEQENEQVGEAAPSEDKPEAVGTATTRPTTKAAMQELRDRFGNTLALTAHLYHDLDLRDECRMVYIATLPYLHEYTGGLASQKSQDRVPGFHRQTIFG